MENSKQTLRPHEKQTEQIRGMFDRIARRYDLLNHLLSLGIDRRWRRRLAELVRGRQANRRVVTLLDVATGTGDMALSLARCLPTASVTGVDLSTEMLQIGRRKAAGLQNLTLVEGDALSLPFPDGQFSAVTAVFGVRNFADLGQGLSQMRRVLVPEGEVYILEFSMPRRGGVWGVLYRLYFRKFLPGLGRVISGQRHAYSYLQRSVEDFPDGERFEHILREAGFSAVQSLRLTGGVATIYTGIKEIKPIHR